MTTRIPTIVISDVGVGTHSPAGFRRSSLLVLLEDYPLAVAGECPSCAAPSVRPFCADWCQSQRLRPYRAPVDALLGTEGAE